MLIFAFILLVSPPHMSSVVSISLVGLTPSLVCLYIIISTWCGRLNLCLCIPIICVDEIHISALTSLLLKTIQTCFKNRSNAFNSLSVLEKSFKNMFNGLSVLGKLLQYKRVCYNSLFHRWVRLYVLPVSCLLDDSILSQDIVLTRDDSVCFETYLL